LWGGGGVAQLVKHLTLELYPLGTSSTKCQ